MNQKIKEKELHIQERDEKISSNKQKPLEKTKYYNLKIVIEIE